MRRADAGNEERNSAEVLLAARGGRRVDGAAAVHGRAARGQEPQPRPLGDVGGRRERDQRGGRPRRRTGSRLPVALRDELHAPDLGDEDARPARGRPPPGAPTARAARRRGRGAPRPRRATRRAAIDLERGTRRRGRAGRSRRGGGARSRRAARSAPARIVEDEEGRRVGPAARTATEPPQPGATTRTLSARPLEERRGRAGRHAPAAAEPVVRAVRRGRPSGGRRGLPCASRSSARARAARRRGEARSPRNARSLRIGAM